MPIHNTFKVLCTMVIFFQSTQSALIMNGSVNFDADSDALILGNALYADTETNKEIITHVLARRTNAQRQQIIKAFKKRYKEDLVIKLDLRLIGNLQETVDSMMIPKRKFYARELHKAVDGLGTDERAITEILGTMSNAEILEVSNIYKNVYGRPLRDDLISDTSGNFQNLLMALCNAYRDENGPVDYDAANEDAHSLFDSIHENYEIEETFIMIMTTRSYSQLKAIFDEYKKVAGVDIKKAIADRIFDDVYYGLYAIVQTILDKSEYYARELEDSMLGIGTRNSKLIRIIVGRSEIDLKYIKQSYEKIYGMSLVSRIDDDTSGKYNYLLRTLVKNS